MKKKRGRQKRTTTAALMWRISALVLGLWLIAMSYLTVILAQQVYDHYEDHVQRYTSRHSFAEAGDPVGLERKEMLEHMATFDEFAFDRLDIPLYRNPYEDEYLTKRILDGDLRYDAAMVFFDSQEQKILDQRGFAAVVYMTEEEWHSGGETAEHYTYVDMTETDVLEGYAFFSLSGLSHWDMTRLTGYFEGDRFVVTDRDYLNIRYPGLLPKDQTLGQLDSQGQLQWEEGYEGSVETDRELVRIYSEEIVGYERQPQPVTVGDRSYEGLDELAEDYAQHYWYTQLGRESLWDAVIVRAGTYTDTNGETARYAAAIRCYPLPSTMLRLQNFYLLTLIPLVVLLLLIWRRIRRELADPLWQLMEHGQKDFAPLPDTMESWWWEPYELEQWYVGTQQQMQELRQETRQLRTALDYAKNAEESRKQMVSNITHELKTPLAIIHSYAEGLEEGIAAEKQAQYLQVIREEAERMDGMVLEMLDLSRLEAGKVRLQSDRFSLLGLTRSVFDDLELLIQKKGLQLHYDLAEDFQITADEGRIGQVVRNFATNAIKYAPEGGNIWVNVYRHKEKTIFTMENECEPLPEEALEKVWDSFYRVSASRTEKGTGLGLTIAKTIIDLHGGTCHAQNTQNGVLFQFQLP